MPIMQVALSFLHILQKVKTTLRLHTPGGYKTFFMLNSTEHKLSTAHKN